MLLLENTPLMKPIRTITELSMIRLSSIQESIVVILWLNMF